LALLWVNAAVRGAIFSDPLDGVVEIIASAFALFAVFLN
jgi:hypothetical protein